MRSEETKHGNTRIIRVDFLGATNHRGSRVKLTEDRYNKKDTIILSYDYKIGGALEQAVLYLKGLGLNILGYGSNKDSYFIFSDSWQYDKEFININPKNI